ncbi:MAG: HAMP domain-containing histidine kinase [Clostridiales Family XIII bacterium]|nr:HAMP domain-containing histidine kinase [Clostridiales Family XIII bacterium]
MDTKSKKLADRFSARLIAFILVVALISGAAGLAAVGHSRLSRLEYESGSGYVSAPDIFFNESYFETDNFRTKANIDSSQLTALYGAFGGQDPRDPSYLSEEDAEVLQAYESDELNIYQQISNVILDESYEWYWDFSGWASVSGAATTSDGAVADGTAAESVQPDATGGNSTAETTQAGVDGDPLTRDIGAIRSRMRDFGAVETLYWDPANYRTVLAGGEFLSSMSMLDTPIPFDIAAMIADPALVKGESLSYVNDEAVIQPMPADFYATGVKEAFERLYADQLAKVRDFIDSNRKSSYGQVLEELDESGLSYFVGDGNASITNVQLGKDGYPADTSVFFSAPAWFSFTDGKAEGSPENAWGSIGRNNPDVLSEETSLFLSYDEEAIADATGHLDEARGIAGHYFIPALICIAAALLLLIFLIIVAGKKRADGTRKLYAVDRIPVEISIGVLLFVEFIASHVAMDIYYGFSGNEGFIDLDFGSGYTILWFALLTGVIAFGAMLALGFLLSTIRNLKARLLLKRSLIWNLLHLAFRAAKALFAAVKSGFDGTNPFAKTILLVALLFFLSVIGGIALFGARFTSAGFVMFILLCLATLLALSVLFTYQRVRKYGKFKEGVEKIAGGDLRWRIPVREEEHSEFDNLSKRINEIGAASDVAVQSELKNQRLKTDLISNVSHDLKTPLTSIITYTDLLKKEGLQSENAPEYLKIIDEKSKRLQKLTEDLFDAAKASSGAVQVRKEKLDLLSLLDQEIAEMDEGLAAAGLEVIVNGSSRMKESLYTGGHGPAKTAFAESLENFSVGSGLSGEDEGLPGAKGESRAEEYGYAPHCYVLADSRLLWRVVDNLLSNVRKYALPGSRVYIDIHGSAPDPSGPYAQASDATGTPRMGEYGGAGSYAPHGMVVMEMKNISNAKLNIPADELMERFKRGDESRATEGSGLGLAIAKDLVRLQGGRFEIFIDGDLFKTTTVLEQWKG